MVAERERHRRGFGTNRWDRLAIVIDFPDGAVGVFSPDGSRVVARYGFDAGATWRLDPTGGRGERVLTGVAEPVSWQRLAR